MLSQMPWRPPECTTSTVVNADFPSGLEVREVLSFATNRPETNESGYQTNLEYSTVYTPDAAFSPFELPEDELWRV